MTLTGMSTATLTERLRISRHRAGLTQEQIAPLIGTSKRTVARWESDDPAKSTTIPFPAAVRWAKVTGYPLVLLAEAVDEEVAVSDGFSRALQLRLFDQDAPAPEVVIDLREPVIVHSSHFEHAA